MRKSRGKANTCRFVTQWQTRLAIETLRMLILFHGAKAKQFFADTRVAGRHAPKAGHLALRL